MTIRRVVRRVSTAVLACRTAATVRAAVAAGAAVAVLVAAVAVPVAAVAVPVAAVVTGSAPTDRTPGDGPGLEGRRWSAFAAVAGPPFDPAPMAGRCGDPAGTWLNTRWFTAYRWRVNTTSIPEYLHQTPPSTGGQPTGSGLTPLGAALDSARTVTVGHNDCGLPEDLSIRQQYIGTTKRHANVTSNGGCGERDGFNVVSFGKLNPGLLAVTCVWWEERSGRPRSIESDILVDAAAGTYFLDPPANCRTQWDLETILTHEFGHVFGLGHVRYAQHGTLTMSDGIPECTTSFRRLGLGDYLTLRAHYGLT